MKPSSLPAVGAAASLLALLLAACGAPARSPSPPPPEGPSEPVKEDGGGAPVRRADGSCTEEAQVCHDGSTVVRAGPDCAFPRCPDYPALDTPSGPYPMPPTVCTKDARMCPDGSSVGRTGPGCTFPPCPEEEVGGRPPGAPPPGGGSPRPGEPPRGGSCQDLCGNGTCEEMVCMAIGCPCAESKASCPKDCK